jgi:hypothetical protein
VTVHHFTVQQASNPLPQLNPLPSYLDLVNRAKAIHQNGDVYSFSLATNTGTKAQLHYTVTGDYVSKIVVDIAGSITTINVTKINSSPPIAVPAKSLIVSGTTTTPTTTAP